MKGHLKNAVMTTGIVLLTVWVLRKVPMTRGVVDMALNG